VYQKKSLDENNQGFQLKEDVKGQAYRSFILGVTFRLNRIVKSVCAIIAA